MKLKTGTTDLHKGKLLFAANNINYSYSGKRIWSSPLSLEIFSGERILIEGDNGTGKTTLLKIITGILEPETGSVARSEFTHIYIDQEYSFIVPSLTIIEQLERFNSGNLSEHFLRTELHRFLFPEKTWKKKCYVLSGGEKMRLTLCCMEIKEQSPDILILDEPTNNLDIQSMQILSQATRSYPGTVILISHDSEFIEKTVISRIINLKH